MARAATKTTPTAPTERAAKSAKTCVVICRLPHGLRLRLFDKRREMDPQRDGSTREVQISRPRPSAGEVVINGYLQRYRTDLPPAAQDSRFAFTENVDANFFEEWMSQNFDHDAVVNNLIFAAPTMDAAKGKAKELHGETRSGLEPLDPNNLPASFKKIKTFTAESTE